MGHRGDPAGSDLARPRGIAARWGALAHRRLELAIPLAASAVLVAACVIISRKKAFWTDEAATWIFVADPSLPHLLRALWGGVEQVPPLYYVAGWMWVQLFGGSELALRMFTSLAFCVALFLLWGTVRSAYPLRGTAVGVLAVFGTSGLLLNQNAEARFYGLFTATAALALATSIAVTGRGAPRRRLLIGNAIAHAALVLTHAFGALYSGAVLVAMIARDLGARRFRPRVYASVAAGWLGLALWAVPLVRAARATAGHSPIPVPGIGDLTGSYVFESTLLPVIVLAAALLGALSGPGAPHRAVEGAPADAEPDDAAGTPSAAERRGALLALAGALLAVPVVVWVVSHGGASLYRLRYMLPSVLAWAIVLAHVTSLGGAGLAPERRGRGWLPTRAIAAGGCAALCAVLLVFPIRWAREYEAPWGSASGAQRRAMVARRVSEIGRVPIITESMHDFMPLAYYAPPDAPPFFALDWDAARAGGAGAEGPVQQMLLRQLKAHGYFAPNIVPGDEFVCAHERFAVTDAHGYHWYDLRLRDNPAFESEVVDSAFRRQQDGRLVRLILVRRRPGASEGTCPRR